MGENEIQHYHTVVMSKFLCVCIFIYFIEKPSRIYKHDPKNLNMFIFTEYFYTRCSFKLYLNPFKQTHTIINHVGSKGSWRKWEGRERKTLRSGSTGGTASADRKSEKRGSTELGGIDLGSLDEARRKRRIKRLHQLRWLVGLDLGGFQPKISEDNESEAEETIELLADVLYKMTYECYVLAHNRGKPRYIT